jgi:hypothetical protein
MEVTKRKTSTSPTVEPGQEEEEFAQRCKENFKVATLNWLIFSNCISLFFYVSHIASNLYWLTYYYNQEEDWYFLWYLEFCLTSAVVVALRSFLFYNNGWIYDKNTYDPRDRLPEESYTNWAWWSKWVLGFVCPIPRYVPKAKQFIG